MNRMQQLRLRSEPIVKGVSVCAPAAVKDLEGAAGNRVRHLLNAIIEIAAGEQVYGCGLLCRLHYRL
jgi:hypothetical protein